jgi:hypothetical protein
VSRVRHPALSGPGGARAAARTRAIPVPTRLRVLQGRFSGEAQNRLRILAAVTRRLSGFLERVLTRAYNDIYDPRGLDDDVRFELAPSTLQDSASIVAFVSAGLIDREFAVPLAVQCLNGTQAQAEEMLERTRGEARGEERGETRGVKRPLAEAQEASDQDETTDKESTDEQTA